MKPTFAIVIPPPNVTGTLHMGHAFNNTIQDILVRFKRLCGFDVLWQGGTDHAGIATQMVVERQLSQVGKTRHDLGREAFVERVWKWKEESGNLICDQQKRLGLDLDFDTFRFTMDDDFSKAVIHVFVKLYNDGLIFKAKRLVNWDILFQTAISDLEVIHKDVLSHFYHIPYQSVLDSNACLTIATTRPETIFADVALAVHPDDERYQSWIGKSVLIPLIKKEIPVIADPYADPSKGTGVVKITPGHDFNDFEVGKRHNLDMINILDSKGNLNENVPLSYQGLSIDQAREKIIKEIEILKIESAQSSIPYGDRSNVQIQPWLTDQWFVDVDNMAKMAKKVVQTENTKFFPKNWENTLFHWLDNIQPWCISRQLWWGHQIPVWYGPDGVIFVEETKDQAYQKAKIHYGYDASLTQDESVLDTWFSSALWPFVTLGWPSDQKTLEKFYPTNVLVTGFDIIFFWVARMMMMSLYLLKKVPFKDVYIHALVRDASGQKMSKSKGNIIDPLNIIDLYGADALRFTLASLAVPGRDIKLSEHQIAGYRNFITKISHASRFLSLHPSSINKPSHPLDHWICSRFNETLEKVTSHINDYRFDLAAQALYQFFWYQFCDVYLEGIKPVTYQGYIGPFIFEQFLVIAHPFIPFITEELLSAQKSWPTPIDCAEDSFVQDALNLLKIIRSYKGLLGIKERINLSIHSLTDFSSFIKTNWSWISHLGGLGKLTQEAFGIPIAYSKNILFLIPPLDWNQNEAENLLHNAEVVIDKDMDYLNQKINNSSYKTAKPDSWNMDQDKLLSKQEEKKTLNQLKQGLESMGENFDC